MSHAVIEIVGQGNIPVFVGGAPGGPGVQGPPGDVARAADRAALAAFASPTAGQTRYLSETGREGLFKFEAGDFSAEVTSDTLQGIYVAPDTDPTGAAGAWVRQGEQLNPFMFGGPTNYQTGDRSLGTYGESQTPGAIDGVLADSRAACQAMIDQVAAHPNRRFVADFSGGIWGISNRGDGKGLVINQPGHAPRTFIGGEFRGIGSGTTLLHVESGAYSEFRGSWHIRSGADLGSSYGYAARQWETGIWLRGAAMSRWSMVKVSGFSRWGIETDPENDALNNNNIGARFQRYYANNCGSAVDRAGNDFSIAFSASSRSGGANNSNQRTNLTLAAGHEILRVGDPIRSPAGSYHTIMEKVGAIASVYPWLISEAAAGTIASCHGGALKITGKDTAGAGCDLLTSVANGAALYLGSQHGSANGKVVAEGGGLGVIFGVVDGATIGHKIDWLHCEGDTLELLALSSSQADLEIGVALTGTADNPLAEAEVLNANDGTALNTSAGLPGVTMNRNGVVYQSGSNTGNYPNATKSRAFFPQLTNDVATRHLSKIQAAGVPTNIELKYIEPTDRFLRQSFYATVKVAAPDGGAPSDDIVISLNAADAAAGITLNGGAGPYTLDGGAATGPVHLECWLDTNGATKNWVVMPFSGVAAASSPTLAGEAIELNNEAGTRRFSVFESGLAHYVRAGIAGSGAANGTLNVEGQGVSQDLVTLRTRAQAWEHYSFGTLRIYIHDNNLDFTGTMNLDGDLKLAAAKAFYVAGTKVVGSQQGAIANHASDATVNAILTALRSHGLIAT